MASLYTDEVRKYFNTRKWPKGLIIDVEEPEEPLPHLLFVLYRDNFIRFDGEDQKQIAALINECMAKFTKDGIPCQLDVKPNVPRP